MLDSDLFRLRDLIKEIQIAKINEEVLTPRQILNIAKQLQFSMETSGCGDCDEDHLCPICFGNDEGCSKSKTHTDDCELNNLIKAVSDMPAYIK